MLNNFINDKIFIFFLNIKMNSKNELSSADEDNQQNLEEKEQIYDGLKSKIEILDILFHPSENNILNVGCINGKLKM